MILDSINWLSIIVSAIVTLVLSGILIPVLTFVVGKKMTKYFDDREHIKKLEEDERQKELKEIINDVVEEHTTPIDKELEKINDKLGKVADGTMDTLRDRILSSYYKCYEKGYRTQYDIDNVDHMNRDYLALNGNTFVAECMEKFKNIPTEKEYEIIKQREKEEKARKRASKKPKTKKILVEDK